MTLVFFWVGFYSSIIFSFFLQSTTNDRENMLIAVSENYFFKKNIGSWGKEKINQIIILLVILL